MGSQRHGALLGQALTKALRGAHWQPCALTWDWLQLLLG